MAAAIDAKIDGLVERIGTLQIGGGRGAQSGNYHHGRGRGRGRGRGFITFMDLL